MKGLSWRQYRRALDSIVAEEDRGPAIAKRRDRNGDLYPLFAWIRCARGIDRLTGFPLTVSRVMHRSEAAQIVADRICAGRNLLKPQREMLLDHLLTRYGSNRSAWDYYNPGIETPDSYAFDILRSVGVSSRSNARVIASQRIADYVLIGVCAALSSKQFRAALRREEWK